MYGLFAGVFWEGGVERLWRGRKWRFSVTSAAVSLEPSELRPQLLYDRQTEHNLSCAVHRDT